jgi:hypothetical protein
MLITSRSLTTSLKSGEKCVERVPFSQVSMGLHEESIVDERTIEIDSTLVTQDTADHTRLPAMKEMLRQIQFAMTSSWGARTRRPFGETGFLESDYFKNRIKEYLSTEVLETPLGSVAELPEAVVERVGAERTVGEALDMDLPQFANETRTRQG